MLIDEIIQYNCSLLNINCPKVSIANDAEFTRTQIKCAITPDGHNLLIKQQFNDTADERDWWLMLSHECRHIWQATRKADLLRDYQQSADLSLQDYNAQPAEIDAWAWAVMVVSDKLGVRPTLERIVGAELWQDILSRDRKLLMSRLFKLFIKTHTPRFW